ncbi:tRNA (guanosine(37)-N1)-methyltransferase TrmD [Altererythrobacter sp. RZ02]|uniref:tRNA (guanine-N(1)-)-methyltransferase n=1 Tax=Pontixanthobacter rizhaonensis TaxID=2730337 RepID=A0A848QM03_9SPHN|nr:tRNA (guanosine(37)-N1)-methyltransferase TrmD [Pontixanthobacter rizhaonensis]NMW31647.1 tRNA (guanosine(37)-N1)-methyltransferase TrmD [Pontixanthobacter rizhaonensis]
MTFAATILTLYPEMFPGPLRLSLAGRALEEQKWSLDTIQIRDFATDKHNNVDGTPAGGGAGMVLKVDVLAGAVDHAAKMNEQHLRSSRAQSRDGGAGGKGVSTSLDTNGKCTIPILAMTPRGKPITQARIRELSEGPGVTILCGRFEGFDERIFEGREIEEVSVGDIVLSGGEPAALMILDACIRLLPGVMGAASSGTEESFEEGLLEYPQYTRPQEWEGRTIPEVLRSGDHAKIAAWRKSMSEDHTRLRRPDLWDRHIGDRD